ncbi:serine carboxypeptidase II-3-like protein [Tanacetum coccineum]
MNMQILKRMIHHKISGKKRNRFNANQFKVGNALIDETTWLKGMYEFYWTHSLISDEAHAGIKNFCDLEDQNYSTKKCNEYQGRLGYEIGDGLDLYNIYSSLFHLDDVGKPAESLGSVKRRMREVLVIIQVLFHVAKVNFASRGGKLDRMGMITGQNRELLKHLQTSEVRFAHISAIYFLIVLNFIKGILVKTFNSRDNNSDSGIISDVLSII